MVHGISNIMRINYGVRKEDFDYEGEIDSQLTYQENYDVILEKLIKRGLVKVLGGKKWSYE